MNEAEGNSKAPQIDANIPKNIGAAVELFVNQIDSLAETLPLTSLAIQNARVTSSREFVKFLKDECTVASKEGNRITYTFVGGQYLKFQRLMRRTKKANLASTLVPRSLLVALVSQFDAHVGELIRQLFKLKPEILSSSGKQLTYAQLIEFGSIDRAKEYIVEKEIETVLRQNHSEQFQWLESTFDIKLRKGLPAWQTLIELTERRNLFVHGNGVVSRQYLEVCRQNQCRIPDDVSVGHVLPLTREYFVACYECLLERLALSWHRCSGTRFNLPTLRLQTKV